MTDQKRWIMILTAAVMVLAIILFIDICLVPAETNIDNAGIVMDPKQENWNSEPEQPPESGKIRIPGYSKIYFAAGETEVPLTLYNPEDNNCYFAFSLYLDNEEKPIYTSQFVEPGKAIREISLAHGLDAGEYTMYICIDTYDPQTQSAKNGAKVKTELIVS